MARLPIVLPLVLLVLAGRALADEPESPKAGAESGIAWFATWKSGLAEAARTGRPILLVAAAPHCAGVPGIW